MEEKGFSKLDHSFFIEQVGVHDVAFGMIDGCNG
jgi:hypothetical protein